MIDPRQGCPSEQVLTEFVHGVLTEGERQKVRHHLETCVDCRRVVGELNSLLTLGEAPELSDPGDAFNRAVWRRMESRKARRRMGVALLPALAAAVALFIILPLGNEGKMALEEELVERLDLYQNMELIENLDLLEQFQVLMEFEGDDESLDL